MNSDFDYYDKQALAKELGVLGYDLNYREVRKSTMDFSFGKKGSRPLLVLVDHQTNGRGRYGNYWDDSAGRSILMTIIEKSSILDGANINLVSHLIALQLCLALNKVGNSGEVKIKWPNDIMLAGKKIAGVLIERRLEGVAIGIGINVYGSCLANREYLMKKSIKLGRQMIVLDILKRWRKIREDIDNHSLENTLYYHNKVWSDCSFILNKKVIMSLKNSVVVGVVKDSPLGGGLIVETNSDAILVSENDYVPGSCVIT